MIVDFLAGTHIDNAARQLVEAAKANGEATGTFNGITISAGPATTPEQVAADFAAKQAEAAEAYRASPEGRKAADERERRRSDSQQQHDALMNRLPTLNMRDAVAVLDWLCAMQGASDHIGVIVGRQTIVSAFERAGYVSGENCGKDYRPGDRNNMFRYLVGQALSGLKEGPGIHPIIHKFAAEWKVEFCVPQ